MKTSNFRNEGQDSVALTCKARPKKQPGRIRRFLRPLAVAAMLAVATIFPSGKAESFSNKASIVQTGPNQDSSKKQDYVWDSYRYGKLKRFYYYAKGIRRPYGAYYSVEGRKDYFRKFGLHISNSDPHLWRHVHSGFGFSSTEHIPIHMHEHGYNDPMGASTYEHFWHQHLHSNHAIHDHHDAFSSWFFMSYWKMAGLDPYAICVANHKAEKIGAGELKMHAGEHTSHATHGHGGAESHSIHYCENKTGNTKQETGSSHASLSATPALHHNGHGNSKDEPAHRSDSKAGAGAGLVNTEAGVESQKSGNQPGKGGIKSSYASHLHAPVPKCVENKCISKPGTSDYVHIAGPGHEEKTTRYITLKTQDPKPKTMKQTSVHFGQAVTESTKPMTGNPKHETRDRKATAGNWKPETGNSMPVGYISSNPALKASPFRVVGAAALPE